MLPAGARVEEGAPPEGERRTVSTTTPSLKVPRVLVVDDEPDIRELLADALSARGIEVDAAADGAEAIDMATRSRPDVLITDLKLTDCNGLDVIDRVRALMGDIPAVVITGCGEASALAEASRRRPIELMTKPLNVDRLYDTVREELSRRSEVDLLRKRTRRLRRLAKSINLDRKSIHNKLDTTCADLTAAYRTLSGQMSLQEVVLSHQADLIRAKNDDDVFQALFRLFVRRSGPIFGVAMVCDSQAQLRIVGRFGVPKPDAVNFCKRLSEPIIDAVLVHPQCMLMDAGEEDELFDESIRRYLVGLSILAIPLIPEAGEMIGLVLLYRKGEQPFTDGDVALAEMIAYPTALAVRRND